MQQGRGALVKCEQGPLPGGHMTHVSCHTAQLSVPGSTSYISSHTTLQAVPLQRWVHVTQPECACTQCALSPNAFHSLTLVGDLPGKLHPRVTACARTVLSAWRGRSVKAHIYTACRHTRTAQVKVANHDRNQRLFPASACVQDIPGMQRHNQNSTLAHH
jgi:hypothetical protein